MSSSKRVTSLITAGGFVFVTAVAGTAVAAGLPTPVARPPGVGLSDATKSRLKGAGLDAADPGLATKLQARLRDSGASFLGAHASSIRIVRKPPPVSSARRMGGGARAGAASPAFAPTQGAGSGGRINSSMLPGVATFVALYERWTGRLVTGGPLDPDQEIYTALFSSPKNISHFSGYSESVSIVYSSACNGVKFQQIGNVRRGEDYNLFGQMEFSLPANGKWYYYVDFSYIDLNSFGDLGASPRNVTLSVDLGTIGLGLGSFSIPALSSHVGATITLTIDSAPPFVTNNSFGIAKSNGLFANPGATRLDPGTNPSASTSGDDKVGVGVNLGPGWSVTGAKVVAAHSVLDAPNDTTPDNSYRGASVTQLPSSGRLETSVHWHYGPAESLSYTVEWQLLGPGGQRPLLTMPLGGPCDS